LEKFKPTGLARRLFAPRDMRVLLVLLGLLASLAVAGAAFVWRGVYDVGAREPHAPVVAWVLSLTRDRSIAAHSRGIVAPRLDAVDAHTVRDGFDEFHEMCPVCHGEPGARPSAVSQGLNPPAPDLADPAVQHAYTDAELFWIVKNGIRMTGMPAFGETHDDATLWSIVAFLRRLPAMSAKEYAAMADAAEADGHEHHH
jgi:mono/diheme cytochrome c family protein